jgi:hypothetical protein
MKDFLKQTQTTISTRLKQVSQRVDDGISLVTNMVNGLPLFMSVERSKDMEQKFDEKHYFIIPLHGTDLGFSLHTMRVLPEGAPPINTLPKRRVFHFPNEYYEGTLNAHMLESAKDLANATTKDNVSSLEALANKIDALDSKFTFGMLVIGSIAAVFNPLIGAGIAAKAVLPSISGLLANHGLRPLGEKLTQAQAEKKAKEAEKNVLKQFSEANTLKVTNPLLRQLEYVLRTDETQYDPLFDPDLSYGNIPELGTAGWRNLTEVAIYHVYKDIIENPAEHVAARLGPEDVRWLQLMFVGLDEPKEK